LIPESECSTMFEWIETYTLLCLPNQDIGDMHRVYQGHREGLLLHTSGIPEPQERFTPPEYLNSTLGSVSNRCIHGGGGATTVQYPHLFKGIN
jgi:hypothetical protein